MPKNGHFSVCRTMLQEHRYIDFLLARYDELNLPYSFPVSLSYLASPLLMGGTAILCYDRKDELCGALSYIHGTGEHNYEDRDIIQIQVAYLADSCRSTRRFYEGLRFLTKHLAGQEENIQEICFWAPGNARNRRLFCKFAEPVATAQQPEGPLDGYRICMKQLQDYLNKRPHGGCQSE